MSFLATLGITALCFQFAKDHVCYILTLEKAKEIEHEVTYTGETLDYLVAQHQNWTTNEEMYRDTVRFLAEQIDARKHVYAELLDSSLSGLSERITHGDNLAFDIQDYPDFIELIKSKDNGHTTVTDYNHGKRKPHTVYLYWRWIPTNDSYENRLLLVAAVTKYSVDTSSQIWMDLSFVVLFFVSSSVVVGSLMLLSVERRAGGDRRSNNTPAHSNKDRRQVWK
jgi:hypothetical protein